MRILAIPFLVVFLLASGSSFSATLRVPSQYETMHIAVAACSPGDTVLVAPGTYGATLLSSSVSDVVVRSESGREATSVDGFSFLGPFDNLTIDGFTVSSPYIAVHISLGASSSLTISNCSIKNSGNGIAGEGSGEVRILNNILETNSWGIYFNGDADYTISGNEISDNGEGGIHLTASQEGQYMISNNRVTNNSGIGIEIHNAHQSIDQILGNTIEGNGATGISIYSNLVSVDDNIIVQNGGNGILVQLGAPQILNNTIAGNDLSGIEVGREFSSAPHIAKNVIAKNGYAGVLVFQYGNPSIECNDVWGNGYGNWNYVGFIPDQTGYNGNISTDPYFCNASGGVYSLAVNSPALHASCGPMGAILIPGCSNQTAIEHLSWGSIKALYK